MKLSDLQPQRVDFEVCGLGLTYKPYTIADDLNAHEVCGGQEKMVEAFHNFDFKKLSLVAWYQLTLESQKLVVESVSAERINADSGKMEKVNLKPIDKFRQLIIGTPGQIEMITNLIRCKGLNMPDFNDDVELKKWVDQLNEEVEKQTGH